MKTMFYHGVTTDNLRFTVSGRIEGDDLKLGIAICGAKERFIKKMGRIKSESRLIGSSKKGVMLFGLYTDSFKEFSNGQSGTFTPNYFKGKESVIFYHLVSKFSSYNSKELKIEFSLYHYW